MTAIVLGYTAPGRTAEPTVLYAGTDAGAASDISLAPPAGILRTELIKNPVIQRRRFFEPPAEPQAPAAEPEPQAPAAEPEPQAPAAAPPSEPEAPAPEPEPELIEAAPAPRKAK